MTDVLLVASLFNTVKISENLGIGILAAVLRERGMSVEILDPSVEGASPEDTAKEVLSRPSTVLGISVLRDEQKAEVLDLVRALRDAGDERFIVLGGHGPTIAVTTGEEEYPPPMEGAALRPWGPAGDWSTLPWGTRRIGYGDIARYADAFLLGEADLSLPDLVERLRRGEDWRTTPGLAYRPDGEHALVSDAHLGLVVNPPARKPDDLDALPFMARDVLARYNERYPGSVAASINLGRGCFYRCTFCTVAVFQGLQEGSRHRQRSVGSVIDEVRAVHAEFGVTDFNFEDDNFIIKNRGGREKIHELCRELRALPFEVTFSIFCRPDAVDEDLFADLRDAGMTIVYLGLESVHEADLDFFHKGLRLEQIHGSLETLLDLGYSLEVSDGLRVKIGFIAWHPMTTIASLRDALAFVRRYSLPPKILRRKLLLYSGIPIKDQIRGLGLLDPDAVNGWQYQQREMGHLEQAVEQFVQLTVSKPYRDRIRTVEKALAKYRRVEIPEELSRMQREMDERCLVFVGRLLDEAGAWAPGEFATRTERFLEREVADFHRYLDERDAEEHIRRGFALAGLPLDATDAFRQ